MSGKPVYLSDSAKDLKNFAGNHRLMAVKAIGKVLQNPLPVTEGGYGKPLGNKQGNDLAGFLKIKIRDAGIRVVYKLIRAETEMLVVVIGARADDEVYEMAQHRAKKNHLLKAASLAQNVGDAVSVMR
jgi:mRNA interferase RelE/StbE